MRRLAHSTPRPLRCIAPLVDGISLHPTTRQWQSLKTRRLVASSARTRDPFKPSKNLALSFKRQLVPYNNDWLIQNNLMKGDSSRDQRRNRSWNIVVRGY